MSAIVDLISVPDVHDWFQVVRNLAAGWRWRRWLWNLTDGRCQRVVSNRLVEFRWELISHFGWPTKGFIGLVLIQFSLTEVGAGTIESDKYSVSRCRWRDRHVGRQGETYWFQKLPDSFLTWGHVTALEIFLRLLRICPETDASAAFKLAGSFTQFPFWEDPHSKSPLAVKRELYRR